MKNLIKFNALFALAIALFQSITISADCELRADRYAYDCCTEAEANHLQDAAAGQGRAHASYRSCPDPSKWDCTVVGK